MKWDLEWNGNLINGTISSSICTKALSKNRIYLSSKIQIKK